MMHFQIGLKNSIDTGFNSNVSGSAKAGNCGGELVEKLLFRLMRIYWVTGIESSWQVVLLLLMFGRRKCILIIKPLLKITLPSI